MPWIITQKPAFLSDFIGLPRDLQNAVKGALNELECDPITPRGDTIKKLQGWNNVYRYRLGDFRLIYAAETQARMLNLLALGPRGSVYKRFNYDGWDAPDAAITFNPEVAARPEWMKHPEWFRPPEKKALPFQLTPDLLTAWRVAPQYHPALARCVYEDDLLNVSDEIVPGEVLERVINSLWPAAVDQLAAQPDHVVFDPEDLTRYAEGTLAGFLLHLDKQQEPLTRWALAGPTLVKGGPGSGKSTVALYRARAVVEHHLRTTGRLPTLLFTTYTNALIHVSESLLRQLLGDLVKLTKDGKLPKEIRVSTLDKTAQWIALSGGEKYQMADEARRLEALHAAQAAFRPAAFGELGKLRVYELISGLRDDYLLEEFDWVMEGQNCRDEDGYLAADRAGRGMALGRERRAAVWQLYVAYRDHLLGRGLYTWGHLTQAALDRVRAGQFARRWDYVIVDEAQDLKPAALALAVELCREPAGVFLTADANQSLYNRGFHWRNVHQSLRVAGRTRALRRNYRSTRQIAAAAAEIVAEAPTAGPDGMGDAETMAQEYVHSGPPPVLYAARGTTDQWRWIVGQIMEASRSLRLPASAAVVLVPSSEVGLLLADALQDHGLKARFMRSQAFDLDEPCVKVTTLHAAKGLEFPIVVVAHAEVGRLPREAAAMEPEERAAYEEVQRRLFYVGCTRAMRRLFVTYDEGLPSPFLAGLSAGRWQRVGVAHHYG